MPRFLDAIRNDEAATLVEYGILVGLIALVAFAAIDLLGSHLENMFRTIAAEVLNPNTLPH